MSYSNLLSHLHNERSTLSLATIQSALAHHLATLSPLPTPLAATAVSSPLFLSPPFTFKKLESLQVAFRHATHLRRRHLSESAKTRSIASTIFARSRRSALAQWLSAALKGLQGGHPMLTLACLTGLLLGIDDQRRTGLDIPSVAVEDELIVALAEVMDSYGYVSPGIDQWQREFEPAGQDILSLAIILASQSLPLVPHNKLTALPLPILSRILISTISQTFNDGSFLSALPDSTVSTPQHTLLIQDPSPLVQTLRSMTSSPLMTSIASVSKLTSIVLELLLDSSLSLTKLNINLRAVSESSRTMREMARKIEADWTASSLSTATEDQIAPPSRDLAKSIWTTLKTLLFSTTMLADAVLSEAVYLPAQHSSLVQPITPASFALDTLHTFSHLSFVISQFGGVTSASQGFKELKKTFYMALDILAHGDGTTGEMFVRDACQGLAPDKLDAVPSPMRQAKQAYLLASIEQLVPVLSDTCIKDTVWDVCYPHLSDSSHRETYESAHSVVLAIFAAHAQHHTHGPRTTRGDLDSDNTNDSSLNTKDDSDTQCGTTHSTDKIFRSTPNFVHKMVPFYAQCLIENSVDDKLSTPQLCLAYAALVRSAHARDDDDDTHTLTWYCIDLLLHAIHDTPSPTQRHRLHLVLISTVPTLPLPLMLRALDETLHIIVALPRDSTDSPERQELVRALFNEILENVGDREKEAAVRWWYDNRMTLVPVGSNDSSKSEGLIQAKKGEKEKAAAHL